MTKCKTMLFLAVVAVATVFSTGCGSPSTPVPPTSAATATTVRAVPTTPPVTATRSPTAAPTAVPPTQAPTAVTTPPTPTKPAATATRTRAPATKAPAVVPTKAGAPAATASPTPKYRVPTGKAGLLVRNFYGQTLYYTLPNQPETPVAANSEMFFVLDPGEYSVTISVPVQYSESRIFTLNANTITTQDFYAK